MANLTCFVHSYNSEKFISRCLDSILSQKTYHNFKVLIIDDCSTDDTDSIVFKYLKKYNNIYFFKTTQNCGLGKKCLISLESEIKEFVNSDYLFRIDYDDYIIDQNKFEKQINILESNKKLIASCHHYRTQTENGDLYDETNAIVGVYSCKEILRFYIFNQANTYNHTSTYMFRNIFMCSQPPLFRKTSWAFGDILFNFDFLRFGDVHYSDEIMSVYYIHKRGCWTGLSEDKKNIKNNNLIWQIFYFLSFLNKVYFLFLLLRYTVYKFFKKII